MKKTNILTASAVILGLMSGSAVVLADHHEEEHKEGDKNACKGSCKAKDDEKKPEDSEKSGCGGKK